MDHEEREIRIEAFGGPEVLTPRPAAVGAPRDDEAAIRVRAIGVNYLDVYHRTGLYPRAVPFVPGVEGAGVVEQTGGSAGGLAPGDRVCWLSVPGSYATRLVAPAASLIRIPLAVSDELAAASMVQGVTAHYLASSTATLVRGDWALVHAAAGGVGLLLIQMLSRKGVRVIGTCSTAEKAALASAAGAMHTILYREERFPAAVRALTDGRGVDVVFDSVGRSTLEGSLESLRPRGLLVSFGQSSGLPPPIEIGRLASAGSVFLTRPTLAHYTATRAELEERAGAVLTDIRDGLLNVRISARVPLERAAEAHAALESRATTGKLLLTP